MQTSPVRSTLKRSIKTPASTHRTSSKGSLLSWKSAKRCLARVPQREQATGIDRKRIMSDQEKEERGRTISWEDPRALAEAGRDLSGLEYLRKIVAGELPHPPIGVLMNF